MKFLDLNIEFDIKFALNQDKCKFDIKFALNQDKCKFTKLITFNKVNI